jgi:putative spermidine/putrescine transport system ATP-binding protein
MSGLNVERLLIQFPEYTIAADSFKVSRGEFFEIKGPSGFGKTTFLRALMGFQKVEMQSSIVLNERAIHLLPPHSRGLGVVFQDQLLFPHLSAWENATFGIRLRERLTPETTRRAEGAFHALGLFDRRFALVTELSGGERQRVALLRATLFGPECLLLDEPFKGLDEMTLAQVVHYLNAWVKARPVPVVWVSHHSAKVFSGGSIIGKARSTSERHFELDLKSNQKIEFDHR